MAQDCYKLISECTHFQHEAALVHDDQTRDALSKDVAQLHKLVNTRVDRGSAHVLHFADEFANDKGEIQVGLQQVRQGGSEASKRLGVLSRIHWVCCR